MRNFTDTDVMRQNSIFLYDHANRMFVNRCTCNRIITHD